MLTILLHSSKTMRQPSSESSGSDIYQAPPLLSEARELARYVQSLSLEQLESAMKVSATMAAKTQLLWHNWSATPARQLPAIDAFLGDIYSGLQVQTFTSSDRAYANEHLYILSGLYGVLRALDSIAPYRLEMGYRLPDEPYKSLYNFWGNSIAHSLPQDTTIINLSAVEYTKAVFPLLTGRYIISPKFMTIDASTGQPKFVTVHAKIARGSFAHWMITNRIERSEDLRLFNELGYAFSEGLSTSDVPVFVCKQFKGLGLSIRLT